MLFIGFTYKHLKVLQAEILNKRMKSLPLDEI